MSDHRIPFGERNGKMLTVDKVTSGKACDCVCSHCKQPLIARKGKIMVHHFAHAPGSSACPAGMQTAVHRMAIQLIAEEATIQLPDYTRQPTRKDLDKNTHYGEEIHIPGQQVDFDKVETEYSCDSYRVDATGFKTDRLLHIEVKVTHAVEYNKEKSFRQREESMIEIDLSGLSPESVLDISTFKQEVIHNKNNRKWLVFPKGEALYQKANQDLIEKVNAINEPLHIKREELRKDEERKEREHKEFLNHKERQRKEYEDELVMLHKTMTEEWLKYREMILLNQFCPDRIKKLIQEDKVPSYVAIKIRNDWSINAHRTYWQLDLVGRFIFDKKDSILKVGEVTDWLINDVGLQEWVMTLHNLKQDQKKKGKARGKYYGDVGAWFLETWENEAIPHPFAICIKYLERLAGLNILKKVGDYTYRVLIDSHEEYIDYHEKVQQKYVERQALHKALREQSFKQSKEKRVKAVQLRDMHIKAMIVTEQNIFELCAGEGSQCQTCFLSVPRDNQLTCLYCGGEEFKDIVITISHLSVAKNKYSCFPKITEAAKTLALDYDDILKP